VKLWNPRGDNRQPGITWGQRVGEPGCEYLRRWVFNFGPVGSIRVHHWTGSDDDRALHDHPWPFVTFVFRGGYTDVSEQPRWTYDRTRADHVRAPAVRYRPALHAHTVQVDPGGAWTLMFTGPWERDWGFYTADGWLRMRRYFKRYGHHPCD
jgi:hypothetical protein